MYPVTSQKINFPDLSSGELPLTVAEGNGILKVLRNQDPTWLNGQVVELVRTQRQVTMGVVLGYQIEADLEIRQHLNSRHANWLLANHDQIPVDWQQYRIFFWGNLFEGEQKMVYVRFIEHIGRHWQDGYEPLHAGLTQKCLAACVK